MTSKFTPENYVMPLGKYRGMRAVDVSKLYTVDKNGEDVDSGVKYLTWLIQQNLFKHADIIRAIIGDTKQCATDTEEKPKPEPKKTNPKEKKTTVKITTEEKSKTVNFEK